MPRVVFEIEPHLTFEQVEGHYWRAKDAHSARYWLVIRLAAIPLRERGVIGTRRYSTGEIAHITGFSRHWVREVIKRYNAYGPSRFIPPPGPLPKQPLAGRRSALEAALRRYLGDDEKEIRAALRLLWMKYKRHESAWTAKHFQAYLRDEWGLKVSETTAWRYMKALLREHEQRSKRNTLYRGRASAEAFLREHLPLFSTEGRAMPAERKTDDEE